MRENFNNISLLPISDSLDPGRILAAAVTLIADCIHRSGLILEDVREAQNSEFVIRLRQSLCRLALCFLPEASVTQHMLLTASPPSHRDRVTFPPPPFLPPYHTHTLFRSGLCICACLPSCLHLPPVWCVEWSGAHSCSAGPPILTEIDPDLSPRSELKTDSNAPGRLKCAFCGRGGACSGRRNIKYGYV